MEVQPCIMSTRLASIASSLLRVTLVYNAQYLHRITPKHRESCTYLHDSSLRCSNCVGIRSFAHRLNCSDLFKSADNYLLVTKALASCQVCTHHVVRADM